MTLDSGWSRSDEPRPTRIGITGHTTLSPLTRRNVYRHLTERLRRCLAPSHGITCLAAGADQLFARAILATGGTYEVILPAEDYGTHVVPRSGSREFDELMRKASDVSVMPFARSGEEAYLAANRELIRRSDVLFAVWDGSWSGRLGETGAVVEAARQRRMPVQVMWPRGWSRI